MSLNFVHQFRKPDHLATIIKRVPIYPNFPWAQNSKKVIRIFFVYRFTNSFGSITKLRIEYERLKSYLSKTDSPIVFAHNDLLLGNVVHDKDEGTISFIDYEYSAYNYQAYDIANHFNEFVGEYLIVFDFQSYIVAVFRLV